MPLYARLVHKPVYGQLVNTPVYGQPVHGLLCGRPVYLSTYGLPVHRLECGQSFHRLVHGQPVHKLVHVQARIRTIHEGRPKTSHINGTRALCLTASSTSTAEAFGRLLCNPNVKINISVIRKRDLIRNTTPSYLLSDFERSQNNSLCEYQSPLYQVTDKLTIVITAVDHQYQRQH